MKNHELIRTFLLAAVLGIIYAGQGLVDKAIIEMETYLQLEPDALNSSAVEEALVQLRAYQSE